MRAALLLALALCAAAAAGLAIGATVVPPGAVWSALTGRMASDDPFATIVRDVRLPRVALGMLVGAALAMSGAALQGVLRNRLAEPYLLGVSGGSAVGAVVVVALGVGTGGLLPPAAFAGALAAVAIVLGVARAAGAPGDPRLLLMAGVVVGAFANAAIMVMLADAPGNSVRSALWWMMGSLGAADWGTVRWLAATLVLAGGALLHMARAVDLLALGEEAAASLGADPDVAGRRVFVVASLLAAATVAAAGLVGFVGLIVPHVARGLAGARHRLVFVFAAMGGATLVVLADVVARTARAPAELPLGAVTAMLGVPFFLALLRRPQ